MDNLLKIPRFLDRVELQRVMDERNVGIAVASKYIMDEDAGTPMPRIRVRKR